MKICLVAHFKDNPVRGDIGTKNVAYYLAKELSKRHEILQIDVRGINSWRKIKAFKPQIIHLILGPSTLGFIAAKAISLYSPQAKVIMSAPNPSFMPFKRIISFLKPDLILAQSLESEKMFKNLGLRTKFLPNGVDIEKFTPIPNTFKEELRRKYGLDKKFVILHVGPIIKARGVGFLKELQNDENQIVIVGREPKDMDLYKSLKKGGCFVWVKRFVNIEELYALSDCYIFPTPPGNKRASIELPLSVLEAMSSNLPVITTRFGALPRIFDDGDGLFFVEKEEDFYKGLEEVKNGAMEIKTREKILPYSWENIMERLERIYNELLH